MPTEYGSPIYPGYRPRADASMVALIRRAGGTLIGKTVTTEFAHLDPGKTRNPHNLAHTPGGSSSGSAAGVAAGMLPIAIGTQTGGSVIRPAAYCGVAGFKPSYRLLPTVGMKCFSWHLDTAGLFAAASPTSPSPPRRSAAAICASTAGRPPRRASRVLRDPPWPAASADMHGGDRQRRARRAAAGATVSEIVLPPILDDAFARTRHHPGLRSGPLARLRIRHPSRQARPRAARAARDAARPSTPTPTTTPAAHEPGARARSPT